MSLSPVCCSWLSLLTQQVLLILCTPCTRSSRPGYNFAVSAVCLRPSGDLTGVLEFPFLTSHTFYGGCCARWNGPGFKSFSVLLAKVWILTCLSFLSAVLGFLLLLATVRLKSGFSLEHFGVWIFLAKVIGLLVYALRRDCFLKSASEAAAAVIGQMMTWQLMCWCFPQVTTMCLSPFIFNMDINVPSLLWWVFKDCYFAHLYF